MTDSSTRFMACNSTRAVHALPDSPYSLQPRSLSGLGVPVASTGAVLLVTEALCDAARLEVKRGYERTE